MKDHCLACSLLAAALVLSGCMLTAANHRCCDVTMANGSPVRILSVQLDPDRERYLFGFLAPHGAGATVIGCTVRFSEGLAIQWQEDGAAHRVLIDLRLLARHKDQIRGLTLLYIGGDNWKVVAREGTEEDSKVVFPE